MRRINQQKPAACLIMKPMNLYSEKKTYGPALTRCPLCGGSYISPLYNITRFEKPFQVDRCGACGFMFMNPPFSDDVINSFYGEDYFNGSADFAYLDERKIRRFASYVWDKRIEVLHRHIPSGNFLDVGASFGGLMEAAKAYYSAHGIELSPYAGAFAAAIPDCRVHIGTLKDHPFSEGYFSAITMIELLEHLKDPLSAIGECYRLLGEGGVLVLQTANMEGLQARMKKDDYNYFLPGHVSYFSKRNLTEALLRAGFSGVRAFIPVEFGLLPKLRKSRGSFQSLADYRSWLRIAWYHGLSKIHFRDFCATSSMVLYAFK